MGDMFNDDQLSLDCGTCIGSGTTACSDCLVSHLLANDDGPIEFVPVRLAEVPRLPTPDELAVAMLSRAGLLDDTPHFVSFAEFESGAVVHGVGNHLRV
jgi:hypothetical protein